MGALASRRQILHHSLLTKLSLMAMICQELIQMHNTRNMEKAGNSSRLSSSRSVPKSPLLQSALLVCEEILLLRQSSTRFPKSFICNSTDYLVYVMYHLFKTVETP